MCVKPSPESPKNSALGTYAAPNSSYRIEDRVEETKYDATPAYQSPNTDIDREAESL